MGVFTRPDSPFFWILLEGTGPPATRESTGIPIAGGTEFQTKQNKKLAQEAYAARMGDLARGHYKLNVDLPPRRFQEHAAWYLEHVSPTKRNLLRERSIIRSSLLPFFARRALGEISREDAQEWMTWRLRAVKPNSVRRELDLLQNMLSNAVPTYLAANPLKGFPGKGQLRIVQAEPRILTPAEEKRLLAAVKDQPQAYALILCALDTLMRMSDVVNLTRAADHGRYITVLDPKVRTYKVPVSGRLRKALDAIRKDRAAGKSLWVFPAFHRWTAYEGPRGRRTEEKDRKGRDKDRRGGRAPQASVERMFKAACAAAGITYGRKKDGEPVDGITFHSLRHTGASRALAGGADVRTVQEIGGWTNLKQLTRYTHPTDAAKLNAVNAIGGQSRRQR